LSYTWAAQYSLLIKVTLKGIVFSFFSLVIQKTTMCRELVQALLEGYSATDADLREQVKGEGSMATVAFVCGRQLVMATAGTSCAYPDTGAHIYPVRDNHVSADGVNHLASLFLHTNMSMCWLIHLCTQHTVFVSVDDGIIACHTHTYLSADYERSSYFCTLAHTHIHLDVVESSHQCAPETVILQVCTMAPSHISRGGVSHQSLYCTTHSHHN
jgi:hypothetical protein